MKRIFVVLAFGLLSVPLFANAQVSEQVESAEQMVSDCKPLANAKIAGDEGLCRLTSDREFVSARFWLFPEPSGT